MPVTALIADSTFKPSKGVMYANIPVDKLLKTSAIVNPDHMPITKPTNTDKCMPIVKTDRTGYNMPIAGQSKPQGPPRIYLHYKTKSGADSVVRR